MRTLAPIRIRAESWTGWKGTCRICGQGHYCDEYNLALEFAYGHMAVMHPHWHDQFAKHGTLAESIPAAWRVDILGRDEQR